MCGDGISLGQSHLEERCRDYNTITEGIVFSQNRRIQQHEYDGVYTDY